MSPDRDTLVPLLVVVGVLLLLAPLLPRDRFWPRVFVVAVTVVVIGHYLSWRIPVTIFSTTELSIQSIWLWLCFAVEQLAILDALILLVVLTRTTDRSTEADRHETRLRSTPSGELPTIDVFIATYNEPFDVLEKTIVGATFLEWPRGKLRIWVLDDGRRGWLQQFCELKGVGYLTRSSNEGAKAGNLNAALQRTDGEFIAVFDADFIPRRDILYRMIGFFEDPRVGIVQAPHNFFNSDPLQANLALRKTLPDDQRLFFDRIMPGRDGWDCAFCCGSNSITRRAAIDAIGGRIPTDSVTEDLFLTLTLLRYGYITRYLDEKLAIGLAPESMDAFFIQRKRWARGAMQIVRLPMGPLGPGLSLIQRIIFMPSLWIIQGLVQIFALTVPIVFMWTGLAPLLNVRGADIVFYQIPVLVAFIAALRFFAPSEYFPLASSVASILQAFKVLPTAIFTLIKPSGHLFKVTPKGRDARRRKHDLGILYLSAALMALTVGGLLINAYPETRVVYADSLVPIVAFWATFNLVVLFLVGLACWAAPVPREEERFNLQEPCELVGTFGRRPAVIENISLSGVRIISDEACSGLKIGDWIACRISEVGWIAAEVKSTRLGVARLQFHLPISRERDLLIRRVFTSGLDNAIRSTSSLSVTIAMLRQAFGKGTPTPAATISASLLLAEPTEEIVELLARLRAGEMEAESTAAA